MHKQRTLFAGAVTVLMTMLGCAGDVVDDEDADDDESASSAEAALAAGAVRVTQWNLATAGRYDPYPNCKSERGPSVTWRTAENAARAVRENGILRTTTFFGLQDIGAPEGDVAPTAVLASLFNGGGTTKGTLNAGGRWGHVYFPHARGVDTGIVYRQDLFRLVRAFPVGDVGGVNNASLGQNAFRVAWGGALFEATSGAKKKVAVFTGKLVWNGEVTDGAGRARAATEADRVAEVKKLDAYIDRNMAGLAGVTRVITIDLNTRVRASAGPSAWEELHRRGYETGWAARDASADPRSPYREFDQVFWDRASSGGRPSRVPFRSNGPCTPQNPGPGGDHDIMSAPVKLR